ncbi:MAG TPA: hypothetical protein VK943_14835, partial [Arenibaculum sp.]|nr:hypothetical protein [Arenibaculum sp.]
RVPEVGMAAVSYAVGPALLAALDPMVADGIRFVFAIGGYHDIVASITYLTTGAYRPDAAAPWRFEPVFESAKWLFLDANAGRVGPPDDVVLKEIAGIRLDDPDAPAASLAARLGPDGRAVYRLLTNEDPDRVPELFAALPRDLRRQIEDLDLSRRDLGRLEADLILVHGRNDPMVPYTQSVELARAAPPERATLFLVDDLLHVELGLPALGDALTLIAASYRLLSERDALPRPSFGDRDRANGSAR